jgi:hypothetical protein
MSDDQQGCIHFTTHVANAQCLILMLTLRLMQLKPDDQHFVSGKVSTLSTFHLWFGLAMG